MEILNHFLMAPAHLKFLIITVDYFTMWVEEEALENMISSNIQNLFKGAS